MKIKIENIKLLLNDVDSKIKYEPVIRYTLDEMLSVMQLDSVIKEYIDIENFITCIRKHKLLEWEKFCLFVKDNKVHFFKYISKR